MTFPTASPNGAGNPSHTTLQVNDAWTRMDVPGGWIYMTVVSNAKTGQFQASAVFVPEPFVITEQDIKHESGKLKVLKAILPLLGRLIRR